MSSKLFESLAILCFLQHILVSHRRHYALSSIIHACHFHGQGAFRCLTVLNGCGGQLLDVGRMSGTTSSSRCHKKPQTTVKCRWSSIELGVAPMIGGSMFLDGWNFSASEVRCCASLVWTSRIWTATAHNPVFRKRIKKIDLHDTMLSKRWPCLC